MEKENKLNKAKLEEMERQLQSFQALEEKYKSEIIYLSNEVKRKTVAVKSKAEKRKVKRTSRKLTTPGDYEEEIVTSEDDCDVTIEKTDAGCQTTSCGESWVEDQTTLPLSFQQDLHSETQDPLSLRSRVEHEVKIRDLEKSIASLTALLQIKESEILQLQKAKDTLQTQIDELLHRNTEVQSIEQKSEHSGVQHSDLEEIKSKLKDLETKLSSKHRNQHNQGR
uniref:Uncharacterized protein n=1 Tax=Ciona savignyi TaxID=51511 RepID=H2Z2A7_CIOSA